MNPVALSFGHPGCTLVAHYGELDDFFQRFDGRQNCIIAGFFVVLEKFSHLPAGLFFIIRESGNQLARINTIRIAVQQHRDPDHLIAFMFNRPAVNFFCHASLFVKTILSPPAGRPAWKGNYTPIYPGCDSVVRGGAL